LPILKNADLLKHLDEFDVYRIIKHFGLESLPKLKEIGVLDDLLDCRAVAKTIIRFGQDLKLKEVLSALEDVGALERLNSFYIAEIIICLGLESLEETLSELKGIDVLKKLSSTNIPTIIVHLGIDSLPILKNAGLIKNLEAFDVYRIIKHFGLESLPKLKEIGVLDDLLHDHAVAETIVRFGEDLKLKEVLSAFKDVGALERLNSFYIAEIIRCLGLESLEETLSELEGIDLLKKLASEDIPTIITSLGIESLPFFIEKWDEMIATAAIRKATNDEDAKRILSMEDKDGFSLRYHLLQSGSRTDAEYPGYKLDFNYDKNLLAIRDEDMPEGHKVIIDGIFRYYYHDDATANSRKTAIFFVGNDHNHALEKTLLHPSFIDGYNVMVIDTRAYTYGDENNYKRGISKALLDFIKNNSITISKNPLISVDAHGLISQNSQIHKITMHHFIEYNDYNINTSDFIKEIVEKLQISTPIQLSISSCYGWHSADGVLQNIPDGSEVVFHSKYRINNGAEEKDSDNLRTSSALADFIRKKDSMHISAKELTIAHTLIRNKKLSITGSPLYIQKGDGSSPDVRLIPEDMGEQAITKCYQKWYFSKFLARICETDAKCVAERGSHLELLNSEDGIGHHYSQEEMGTINAFAFCTAVDC